MSTLIHPSRKLLSGATALMISALALIFVHLLRAQDDTEIPSDKEFNELGQEFSDAVNQAFAIPSDAFAVFPETLRGEVRDYIQEVLRLIQGDQRDELDVFLRANHAKIGEIFDQLGIEDSADGLIDIPSEAAMPLMAIKFPDEYENYPAYLESLNIEPWERDYLLSSHDIANSLRSGMATALNDDDHVASLLERYQEDLQVINERYSEQIREKYLETLEQANEDGRRPDDDR